MGVVYQCKCKACGNGFVIHDGDGMRKLGLICNTCGQRSYIPRQAPRPPREGREVPSFLQTSQFFTLPPIPDAQIKRFTADELANIDQLATSSGAYEVDRWDGFEMAALIAHKNPCECGGLVNLAKETERTGGPNTMTRCPSCQSNELTATATGVWD